MCWNIMVVYYIPCKVMIFICICSYKITLRTLAFCQLWPEKKLVKFAIICGFYCILDKLNKTRKLRCYKQSYNEDQLNLSLIFFTCFRLLSKIFMHFIVQCCCCCCVPQSTTLFTRLYVKLYDFIQINKISQIVLYDNLNQPKLFAYHNL